MSNSTHIGFVPDSVADQTHDAMAEVGATTVAGLLGTYQANRDATDALLGQCLSLMNAGELRGDHLHRLMADLERAQRRLYLYSMLATEGFGS